MRIRKGTNKCSPLPVGGRGAFAPPCALGAAVGHLATVHDLGDDAEVDAHTGDGGGLLGREHATHVLGHPLGGHLAVRRDGGDQFAGEPLVFGAGLGRALALGARLGDGRVHLGQHVHDLGHVLHPLDGDGEGVGTGDGVLLGHGRPLSVLSG